MLHCSFGTLYLREKNNKTLWQPQDFNLCEQRNTLVHGTLNLAWKAKEKERCPW